MTNPAPTETGERCPDCMRPLDGEVGETCIIRGGDKYIRTERDNLRSQLSTIRECDEHMAWERGYAQGYGDRERTDMDRADVLKEPNPYPADATLRAREQLESAVVEAAIQLAAKVRSESIEDEDVGYELGMVNDLVDALLAHRALKAKP